MPRLPASQQLPLRRRRWVWALAGVLAVHGWLLTTGFETVANPSGRSGASALRIVQLQAPPKVERPAPGRSEPRAHPPPAAAVAQASTAPTAATDTPDTAPTVVAPAAEWRYQLRQHGKQGSARLSWQPEAGGYRLLLERELDGKPLPGWRSQGAIDVEGLAPQRYATQRNGRDAQATNFRRDEGLISFSASTGQVALTAGVQDRLSWWLQLGARVAGAPQRFGPGSEIRLPVVGLRGEPQDWVFEVIGEESLALPGSVVASALHLRRAAMGVYDGAIDVWLDPARGHLPVKLSSGSLDEHGWELQLSDDRALPR